MGCCGSADAAGEKKGKKGQPKPDIVAKDLEDVSFPRQVKKATYGLAEPEEGSPEPVDVTDTIRELIAGGDTEIKGGIHTAVGNPPQFEGKAKVFKAWLLPVVPDLKVDDFEHVKLTGVVIFATYGVEGGEVKDVTALMQKHQAEGKTEFVGGPHTAVNEPLPSDPNVLCVWYA